ncbi:MAG: hypothetical protein ACI8W8_003638 [Rhodothermales bacterium]|jgi:hypothetical protein
MDCGLCEVDWNLLERAAVGKERWCRICDRQRPNEKFSGRGHRDCICKECQKLPQTARQAIDIQCELYGFIEQSRISDKNIKRLSTLASHEAPDIAEHAAALLAIAKVYPFKKKRWKRLAKTHFHLLQRYKKAVGIWEEADVYDCFGEEISEPREEFSWVVAYDEFGDGEVPF